MTLIIRLFESADQKTAQQLVQEGLGSRFGHIDYSMNPDLNDIQANYLDRGHWFYVAELAGVIVGTCALTNEAAGIGRIERMSVRPAQGGKGFARQMTNFLINQARLLQMNKLVVETNESWDNALHLYRSSGFIETHRKGVQVHMAQELGKA
ncbi:MAG: GNAT family N-acetyltransferase [Candidatus Promineifilaceae bacterium]